MYEPSVGQWMCLCSPHWDSSHCALHCYCRLSRTAGTGTSLCTSGWRCTRYRGRPVAAALTNKERNKESTNIKRRKERSDTIQGMLWGPLLFVRMQVCTSLCLYWYDKWTEAEAHTHAHTTTTAVCVYGQNKLPTKKTFQHLSAKCSFKKKLNSCVFSFFSALLVSVMCLK